MKIKKTVQKNVIPLLTTTKLIKIIFFRQFGNGIRRYGNGTSSGMLLPRFNDSTRRLSRKSIKQWQSESR